MEKLPILLITYKRLGTTKQVLDSIKVYRPDQLFLFSDGPKDVESDLNKIQAVRGYIDNFVDWPCSVQKMYKTKNIGCKYGPQSAITWFFENVEQGIILEDDTVPNESFYIYCRILLEFYRNDFRIWNIAGTKLENHQLQTNVSYRFSKFPHTWGWATWANRWKAHVNNLPNLKKDADSPLILNCFPNKNIIKEWKQKALVSLDDELDAWDYLWSFRVLMNGGLSISPNKNLVSNIGFGEDATHTFVDAKNSIVKTEKLDFPLVHPRIILPDIQKDIAFFEEYFNWKTLTSKLKISHIIAVIRNRLGF